MVTIEDSAPEAQYFSYEQAMSADTHELTVSLAHYSNMEKTDIAASTLGIKAKDAIGLVSVTAAVNDGDAVELFNVEGGVTTVLPIGEHTVTWTVVDTAGLTVTETQSFVITDQTAPLFADASGDTELSLPDAALAVGADSTITALNTPSTSDNTGETVTIKSNG